MKILILILGCKLSRYNSIESSIRATWASNLPNNISVLFYYGSNYNDYILNGNELYCPCKEQINVTKKTLSAFYYVNKNIEFELLYRICNGSYINISNFIKYISTITNYSKLFNGVIGHDKKNNIDFISGAGMLFSKDVIIDIITNYTFNEINSNYQDDVYIGNLCKKLHIKLTNASRVDIYNDINIDKNFIAANKNIEHHFHFRNNPQYMYQLDNYFKDVK